MTTIVTSNKPGRTEALNVVAAAQVATRVNLQSENGIGSLKMAETAPEETLVQLTRLSQKPGVQSTLLLSRQNGAIVRTSGLISKSNAVNPNSTLPASSDDTDAYTNGRAEGGMQSAEDVARLVLKFVDAAGTLVDGLDKDEEVKLLRVRTRKNELVIVPSTW